MEFPFRRCFDFSFLSHYQSFLFFVCVSFGPLTVFTKMMRGDWRGNTNPWRPGDAFLPPSYATNQIWKGREMQQARSVPSLAGQTSPPLMLSEDYHAHRACDLPSHIYLFFPPCCDILYNYTSSLFMFTSALAPRVARTENLKSPFSPSLREISLNRFPSSPVAQVRTSLSVKLPPESPPIYHLPGDSRFSLFFLL